MTHSKATHKVDGLAFHRSCAPFSQALIYPLLEFAAIAVEGIHCLVEVDRLVISPPDPVAPIMAAPMHEKVAGRTHANPPPLEVCIEAHSFLSTTRRETRWTSHQAEAPVTLQGACELPSPG
jgi:hypothetical protein